LPCGPIWQDADASGSSASLCLYRTGMGPDPFRRSVRSDLAGAYDSSAYDSAYDSADGGAYVGGDVGGDVDGDVVSDGVADDAAGITCSSRRSVSAGGAVAYSARLEELEGHAEKHSSFRPLVGGRTPLPFHQPSILMAPVPCTLRQPSSTLYPVPCTLRQPSRASRTAGGVNLRAARIATCSPPSPSASRCEHSSPPSPSAKRCEHSWTRAGGGGYDTGCAVTTAANLRNLEPLRSVASAPSLYPHRRLAATPPPAPLHSTPLYDTPSSSKSLSAFMPTRGNLQAPSATPAATAGPFSPDVASYHPWNGMPTRRAGTRKVRRLPALRGGQQGQVQPRPIEETPWDAMATCERQIESTRHSIGYAQSKLTYLYSILNRPGLVQGAVSTLRSISKYEAKLSKLSERQRRWTEKLSHAKLQAGGAASCTKPSYVSPWLRATSGGAARPDPGPDPWLKSTSGGAAMYEIQLS